MFPALALRMTGPAPIERSGDDSISRRGSVSLLDVLELLKQNNDPIVRALESLENTLTREMHVQTAALADRLNRHENEAHRRDDRIAALEKWRDAEELDEAFRRGFWHVVLLGLKWSTQHWQFVLIVLGWIAVMVWTLTGNQPVGVGPINPTP